MRNANKDWATNIVIILIMSITLATLVMASSIRA